MSDTQRPISGKWFGCFMIIVTTLVIAPTAISWLYERPAHIKQEAYFAAMDAEYRKLKSLVLSPQFQGVLTSREPVTRPQRMPSCYITWGMTVCDERGSSRMPLPPYAKSGFGDLGKHGDVLAVEAIGYVEFRYKGVRTRRLELTETTGEGSRHTEDVYEVDDYEAEVWLIDRSSLAVLDHTTLTSNSLTKYASISVRGEVPSAAARRYIYESLWLTISSRWERGTTD